MPPSAFAISAAFVLNMKAELRTSAIRKPTTRQTLGVVRSYFVGRWKKFRTTHDIGKGNKELKTPGEFPRPPSFNVVARRRLLSLFVGGAIFFPFSTTPS
jgi:hypothetical protein